MVRCLSLFRVCYYLKYAHVIYCLICLQDVPSRRNAQKICLCTTTLFCLAARLAWRARTDTFAGISRVNSSGLEAHRATFRDLPRNLLSFKLQNGPRTTKEGSLGRPALWNAGAEEHVLPARAVLRKNGLGALVEGQARRDFSHNLSNQNWRPACATLRTWRRLKERARAVLLVTGTGLTFENVQVLRYYSSTFN